MPVQDGWQIVTLGGRHAAAARPAAVGTHRVRGAAQGRGANPTGSFKDRGMTVAVTEALARGKQARAVRVHRQHLGVGRRLRRPRGHHLRGADPAGQDRAGQARAGRGARRPDPADRRQLRRLPGTRPQDRRRLPDVAALVNSVNPPDRRAEDRRLRDLRRARPRARRALPARSATRATSPRTGRATRRTRRRADPDARRGCSASRPPGRRRSCTARRCSHPETIATAIRIGAPASWAAAVEARDASGGRFAAVTDDEILAAYRLLAARARRCSSSPRRRRAWRGCCSRRPTARCRAGRWWSARSPGTG